MNIHKYFKLFVLLTITTINSYAQSITENVNFDNFVSPVDNDFTSWFTGGLGIIPIATNGITGGCLSTPNTVGWGNDNAIYCSKYVDSTTHISNTRISFKYDTTQINSINYDRAVSLFLRPAADFNHYVIASVTYDKKIQIVTYSVANNPYLVNLVHNHWYEFILNVTCLPPTWVHQLSAWAQVNDLGLSGQDPPVSLGNSSISFYDSLLYEDTAVQVSFTGTLWGGTKFLDNFQFQGVKSADSCNAATGLNTVETENIFIKYYNNTIYVNQDVSHLEINVFSISGQKMFSNIALKGESSFSVPSLEPGVYIVRVYGKGTNSIRKIVVVN